ncbi:MAG: hypothetical protein RSF39_10565 [Romboutsia sp.]
MFFNDNKIRNDKDYFRLVIIIHILLYYMPISQLKNKNWNFNFVDTGNYTGFIALITISLIIVIVEKNKK